MPTFQKKHRAVIGAGSNIEPGRHIPLARERIRNTHILLAESAWIETEPVGFKDQANFVNGAFLIETDMERSDFEAWLHRVESDLGRVRTANKNGPRTIDLDIVVWDGEIVNPDFHYRDFLRKAVREVYPDLGAT